MTGVIIGISLSWKYGKINNVKCFFLSQMFTISGIHVIHIHELKKVMAIKPPSLWAFQVVQISQLSTMTNWISFCYTPSQQASRDCIAWQHVTDVNNRVRPPDDVIPSVDASKVYFVASLLTQYWLACKLTCTKRKFDTHQSVTDITAAIGTPWVHKLWHRPLYTDWKRHSAGRAPSRSLLLC